MAGPADRTALAARWPLPEGGEVRDALLDAYGGPERGYHDLRHLAEVLDRLDELEQAGERFDRVSVRLAAWFHDAVYDGSPTAEARSAAWAAAALADVDATTRDEVERLVLLTVDHRPGADDPDGAALCDADLAILASGPERYAEYVADVRAEYAAVPDDDFRRGRAAVLADLAAKPTLFTTSYGRERWEPAARANLTRELASLRR